MRKYGVQIFLKIEATSTRWSAAAIKTQYTAEPFREKKISKERSMTPDRTRQVLTSTAETVLARRYYLKDSEETPVETWENLSRGVADDVAAKSKGSEVYSKQVEDFYRLSRVSNPSVEPL
jgi:hypothetical protein